MVTPGSLALRFVHSGVWTGMRALASATSWSKDRSSRTGTGIVTTVSSLPVGVDRHLQPLLRTGCDEGVGDGDVDVTITYTLIATGAQERLQMTINADR